MTQFYCDHGAYGAGACMGAILGTTLTVASIASGRIGVGAEISGPGVTYGTYVTAPMTGLGGTGTYTVSVSQTVSSANLTAIFGMPLAIPLVWAQPQDGDGTTTTTAATSSATISLDCSGYTFTSGSSQVSVMGATGITVSASANSGTNAQYSATLTTMLDNIVAAINSCAYNTVNLPTNWQANQVRNTVFARRTGNSLELMTRAGSASYNALVGVAWAGVTGAANGNWAGGSGGCWGVQVNYNTAALPSGLTAGSGYGVMSPALLAGYATGGDIIWHRSGKLIYINPYGSQTVGSRHTGLATALLEHRVDSLQTIWPADPANSVIELRRISSGYNTSFLIISAGNFVALRCPRTANGQRSWVVKTGSANPGGGISISPGGTKVRLVGLSLETTGATTSDPIGLSGVGSSGSMLVCEDVYLHVKGGAPVSGSYADGSASNVLLIACEFDAAGTTTPSSGVVSLSIAGQIVQMDGCKFSNFVTGSRLLTAASIAGTNVEMLDCALGNIDLRGPQFGTAAWQQGKINGRIIIAASDAYRDFAMESPQGFIEWNYKRDQPLLAAKLHDGTTGWSVRVVPSQIAASNLRVSALKCPPMVKLNTLATAARTVTVEMLIASALSWTAADVDLFVSYFDSSGIKRFATTYDANAGALAASTAAWSKTTFVDGGTINFSKFKLSVSLPSLLTGTIITATVRVNREVANTTQGLFYDPEFVLA